MCQILVFKRTKIGVLGEVCKDLLKNLFSGVRPPDPFSGNSSPDLLFAQAAWLFISFSGKKETKQRKLTGCTDFSKNGAHKAKTQKLGASLLKQFVFLHAFRTPFS